MGPTTRRLLLAALTAAALLPGPGLAGCYHYNVQAPRLDPATEPRAQTAYSFFWGAVQPTIRAAGCEPSNAMAAVRVTNSLPFALLTVATLGVVSPLRVEWVCAKQQTGVGELH